MIFNPFATTTSPRVREVLVGALAYQLDLQVAQTTHRGHGLELAAEAREDGLDVVIALGGDGTVSEIVNGMLGAKGPGPDVPKLGVVPAGSANVFARSLGYPNDPVEATGELISRIRSGGSRRVSLGKANDRYFTINAGLGIDAEIIEAMEETRSSGKDATTTRYVATALSRFFQTDRSSPTLAISIPGEPLIRGVYLAWVLNTAPVTYIGAVAMNPSPRASFEHGLDLWAVKTLSLPSSLKHFRRMMASKESTSGKNLIARHDLPELEIFCETPTRFQIDGDAGGLIDRMRFQSVPNALEVIV